MKRAIALCLALAAPACKDDKAPQAKAVPLSKAPETRGLVDESAKKKKVPAPPPEVIEEAPDAGGEAVLPPGKQWLSVPGLGVDVAVGPEVAIKKGKGGEVLLADDTSELRMKRGPAGQTASDVKHRLEVEGGGKLGVVVDRSEGDEFRLEYVLKDRKSGAPIFGLAMRRLIDGKRIDCASRGFDTTSTKMAFDACRVMRATPR